MPITPRPGHHWRQTRHKQIISIINRVKAPLSPQNPHKARWRGHYRPGHYLGACRSACDWEARSGNAQILFSGISLGAPPFGPWGVTQYVWPHARSGGGSRLRMRMSRSALYISPCGDRAVGMAGHRHTVCGIATLRIARQPALERNRTFFLISNSLIIPSAICDSPWVERGAHR
jgi:hypothetical protein